VVGKGQARDVGATVNIIPPHATPSECMQYKLPVSNNSQEYRASLLTARAIARRRRHTEIPLQRNNSVSAGVSTLSILG
jgi:hypothetical protein